MNPERIPVVVGAADVLDRPASPADGLEPLALMAAAAQAAQRDAGAQLLAQVDSIDIVCLTSWPYDGLPEQLQRRLGCTARHRRYGEVGGETPIRFIHEAALRIAAGQTEVALVTGAEAQYSVDSARKQGVSLPWTPRAEQVVVKRSREFQHPLAKAHGICDPITVYPLYDNAASPAWGLTPGQARAESAQLWARYAEVAARTPNAWLRKPYDAQEIATPTPANRLIAWPYTKHMVANPSVNLGAAVLLCSLARARSLGIAAERLVFPLGGAAANEPLDVLGRDGFVTSAAQQTVLQAMAALVGGAGRYGPIELYSCFPVVPRMALRVLGLPGDANVTTIGGLSFFGAPLNDYMLHAACGMVRALRERPGVPGLLYGQGGLVTKHHGLALVAGAVPQAPLAEDFSVQEASDARRGPAPQVIDTPVEAATIETFTVVYDRTGAPQYGAIIARVATDREAAQHAPRVLARVPAGDAASLALLTSLERSPVGSVGAARRADDGLLHWHAR